MHARRRSRAGYAGLAATLAVGMALALGALAATAGATFSSTRANGSNSFGAAATFDTYQQSVLADSPLFYHRMDDPAGTTVLDDTSSNNRDGTYNEATSAAYNYRVPGKLPANSAAQFNGVNEYVVMEDDIGAAAPNTFSVELWFKSTSADGGKLIGYGNGRLGLSTAYDRDMYLDSTGKVTFRVADGANGNKCVTSTNALADGNWHHVVGTLGGGFARLYVDGTLVTGTSISPSCTVGNPRGSVAASVGETNPNGYWRVGGDQLGFGGLPNTPASDYINATIDEVAVYTTALTSTQVADHWTVGNNATNSAPTLYKTEVLTESPYLYWRFDEAGSQRAVDQSGTGTRHGFYYTGPDVSINPPARRGGDQWVEDASDTATLFNGVDAYVTTESATAVPGPNSFSIELWFKTPASNTSGGKLVGFGDARTGISSSNDRHIYLDKDMRVTFGVFWSGSVRSVRSASALNNNLWHHIVGTVNASNGEMKLYVDNAVTTITGVNGGQVYNGYWRVGGDKLDGGWPDTPSSQFANATLDEVAIYHSVLSSARVGAHWGQRDAVVGATSTSYRNAVTADNPYLYWRLGESSSAQQAVDSGTGGRHGTYLPAGGALGGTGARNASARFSGVCLVNSTSCTTSGTGTTIGIAAYNPYAQSSPNSFTLEVWFRTRTTVGGLLIGFGSHQTGNSQYYDRNIYMRDDGRLVFGVNPGTPTTVVSTAALNDDAWHHAAASLGAGGMRLYVDGVLHASNTGVTTGQAISPGYWRIGGDKLQGWTNAPSSFHFAGALDEVAVYGSQLTTTRIQVHYHSRNR